MTTQAVDQLALDEQTVNDVELETALEDRQAAREAARAAGRRSRDADEAAKQLLDRQELPEGIALRVGRFRIERKTTPGRTVSFEVERGTRLKISLIGGDE